ncbi:hypothetical protein F5Y07DRAFT_343557 [Xylaria sp. FL0933]|nr:hypothetical protein F5Y07DRAFT_343557 [Xylaria sp. FL0933]
MAAAVIVLVAVDVSLVVDREVGGAQTDSSRDSRLLFDVNSDVMSSCLMRRMIDNNCKVSNDKVRVCRFVERKQDATLSTRLCSRDSTQFN